jgi:hypothetical protein
MLKTLNLHRGSKLLAAVVATSILTAPVMAGAATTTTTISSNINSVISLLSSSGTVNVNVVPTGSGAQTIASDTVTVSTNDSAGYTLQLAETTASSALTSGGNTIPAVSGNKTTPVAMTANTWGYRVDGVGGFGAGPSAATSSTAIGASKFAAVPATGAPDTIKTTSAAASNDTTTVWYGAAADTTQPAGTYTNSVTYTATAN